MPFLRQAAVLLAFGASIAAFARACPRETARFSDFATSLRWETPRRGDLWVDNPALLGAPKSYSGRPVFFSRIPVDLLGIAEGVAPMTEVRDLRAKIRELERALTPEQQSRLQYPRLYLDRAIGNLRQANGGDRGERVGRERKDQYIRQLQYMQAAYFYVRSIGEVTGKPEPKAEERENEFFARINNQRIVERFEENAAFSRHAATSFTSIARFDTGLAEPLQKLRRLDGNLAAQLLKLDRAGSLGPPSVMGSTKVSFAETLAAEREVAQALRRYALLNPHEARRFIELNLEFVRRIFLHEFEGPSATLDGFGDPLVSKEALLHLVLRGKKPPPLDVSEALRTPGSWGKASAAEVTARTRIFDTVKVWAAKPENFEQNPPLQRLSGKAQPLDEAFIALHQALGDASVMLPLLEAYESDVGAVREKYGLRGEDAARVVLRSYENAEGFEGVVGIDTYVSNADWDAMMRSKKVFRDQFFNSGDTHGLDTHRIQLNLVARLMAAQPEKFRTADGKRITVAQLYEAMGKPEYSTAFHKDRRIWQHFFDTYFQNNFSSPAFLTRIRDRFGLHPWD